MKQRVFFSLFGWNLCEAGSRFMIYFRNFRWALSGFHFIVSDSQMREHQNLTLSFQASQCLISAASHLLSTVSFHVIKKMVWNYKLARASRAANKAKWWATCSLCTPYLLQGGYCNLLQQLCLTIERSVITLEQRWAYFLNIGNNNGLEFYKQTPTKILEIVIVGIQGSFKLGSE